MTTTRTDTIRNEEGAFDALVVLPDGGRGPGILLFQEIFGVNDFLRAKAEALAAEGYVVVCPDVFWRVERNVSLAHDEASLQKAFGYMQQYGAIPHETKVADLLSSLAHLRGLDAVTGKTAAMGYCLGGWLAYETACAGDPDACVSYYGSQVAERIAAAPQISCPVLFHFGGSDPFIPGENVEAIRAAFAGRDDVELYVYETAGHAFENFMAPQFSNPEAAEVSWRRTLDFLDRTLR